MPKPRKITDQMKMLIAQAIHEKKYELSKNLTDLLQKIEAPAPEKKEEN